MQKSPRWRRMCSRAVLRADACLGLCFISTGKPDPLFSVPPQSFRPPQPSPHLVKSVPAERMSLLRRISLSLNAKTDGRELPRGTSFNDLSMGAATWGDGGWVPEGTGERAEAAGKPPLLWGSRALIASVLRLLSNPTEADSHQERAQGSFAPMSASVPPSPRLPVHTSPFGSSAPARE